MIVEVIRVKAMLRPEGDEEQDELRMEATEDGNATTAKAVVLTLPLDESLFSRGGGLPA